ncbi:MAG: hypothetical protein IJ147_05900 [Lachnospiraceae bacterium]|nr:hypothetical protein [Lachnospiraceae bacterium]
MAMEHEKSTNIEEDKFVKTVGRWILTIAAIILGVNIICRGVDAVKSKSYMKVTGTVTKTQTTEQWTHAGGRSFEVPTYHVWVKYQIPVRTTTMTETLTENHTRRMFSKGDEVLVLYDKNAYYNAYIAKKDWMTGAYLPAGKNYNAPLIASLILGGIGFLLYTNSPLLDLLLSNPDISIGKRHRK